MSRVRKGKNNIRNILIATAFIAFAVFDVVILLYIFNPGIFSLTVRNQIQNGLALSDDKAIIFSPEKPKEEEKDNTLEDITDLEIKPEENLSKQVLLNVPFTSQAPLGEWSDIRQQEACEEASLIMAWHWVKNTSLSPEQAREEILSLSAFEESFLGEFWDTSAEDSVKIFKGYYNYQNIKTVYDFSIEDIKDELRNGNIVLVPTGGKTLNNPYYTPPGPERHMIIIKGFDETTGEFITNDPGTRFGNSYKYPYQIVLDSIINYGTGRNAPLLDSRKVMIAVIK